MDPVRNPYNPGAGTRPPALVGRDSEIEAMDVALQRLLRGTTPRANFSPASEARERQSF